MKASCSGRTVCRGWLIFGLAALLLPGLTACKKTPRQEASGPVVAESPAPVRTPVLATVSEDRLRLRSEPYLDSLIVTHLMKGDSVEVQFRTDWEQGIEDVSSPWYFIRTDAHSGWTYGAFLLFRAQERLAVPVDPAPKPPAERGHTEDVSLDSARAGAPAPPEILLPLVPAASEPVLPNIQEGTIEYLPGHNLLVLPFGVKNRLRLDDIEFINLVANAPDGREYRRRFSAGEWQRYPDEDGAVVLLPFYQTAVLQRGLWEFYGFLGDDIWPAAVGKAEMTPSSLSLLPSAEPHPLTDSPHSSYRRGGKVCVFGLTGKPGESFQLALYYQTEEIRESKMVLRPVFFRQIKSDEKGRWKAEVAIGEDWPAGLYRAAAGSPVTDAEHLILNATSLNLLPR